MDSNPADRTIGIRPASPVFMRVPEVLQGLLLKGQQPVGAGGREWQKSAAAVFRTSGANDWPQSLAVGQVNRMASSGV